MKFKEPAIKEALDKVSNRVVDARLEFKRQKDAFATRKDYHLGEIDLRCLECDQKLVVAARLNTLYFRHLPNSDYCALKDESLSDEILLGYSELGKARESERHKFLKNLISRGLRHTDGVEETSIIVDSHFIKRGEERRRPDVYCKYRGREIVFEIQLSNLSPKFINHRFEFYKKNGIYLFWILDLKNDSIRSQMERDIQYLTSHQNLFGVDETAEHLRLVCRYKAPFVYNERQVREKWVQKSITLHDITFPQQNEVFYFDYPSQKNKKRDELDLLIAKAKEEEELEEKRELAAYTSQKISRLLDEVKRYHKLDYNFYKLHQEFTALSVSEVSKLNDHVKFNEKWVSGEPLINYYIRTYRSKNDRFKESFVEFLLTQDKIWFDVNRRSPNGKGCLQHVFENEDLFHRRYIILPALFKRGYSLTQFDLDFFALDENCKGQNSELTLLELKYLDRLSDMENAPLIIKHFRYLLFIESAIQKRIIGSGLKNWVQYMVGIQGGFKNFWQFTKVALIKSGTWDLVAQADRKGTIERKVAEFNLETLECDYTILPILNDLFPTLFDYKVKRYDV